MEEKDRVILLEATEKAFNHLCYLNGLLIKISGSNDIIFDQQLNAVIVILNELKRELEKIASFWKVIPLSFLLYNLSN